MAKMSIDTRHAIEAFAGVFDNTSRKPIEHNAVDPVEYKNITIIQQGRHGYICHCSRLLVKNGG